jgi:uncharacterized protein (DUF2141 family)
MAVLSFTSLNGWSCEVGVNERISRRSAMASPEPKVFKMRYSRGGRFTAGYASMVLAGLASSAGAESVCLGIHVEILNINNSTGKIACALFESPEGFPAGYLNDATNIMVIKIRETQARCDFEDIAPGTYALAVIHDENMNGKLDTNWAGFPKEGYGFSMGAKATFGTPSFKAASFSYDGQLLNMTISMRY